MSHNATPPPMPGFPPPPPAKKNHTNTIIIGSAAATIAAIVAAGVLIASNRDDEATPTPTVTVTVIETETAEADTSEGAATTDQSEGFKTGEEATNGGAVVKITKVVETDSITLEGSQKKAGSDAKFVTLKTIVKNEGQSSMDLTCSLPIVNALIDDQNRRFDTIEDLYQVAGNPECNAQLQPGFKDEMQFVYRVPKDTKVTAWEFSEYDLSGETTPTLIDLA
ncbi:hypothetical protein [Streptomyces sp. NBC_00687]|uniref:hypothetical protein n=1 Tax=Streptomyces sp. NBC_00687 TaxID=2975807 RepID=UPI00224D5150|nr:hypothetical protein [Streptomyces sp. NBC_00687]MCX4920105.1 hypothetical protein [Streptomyces sp. NBC_00687]